MSDIDWSKAPEDATHGRVTAAGFDFYRIFNGTWCYMAKSGNWEPAIIGNARLCVERPKAWNGESPPPTGTVCEVRNSGLHNPVWEKCTILFCGKHRVLYDSESCSERCGYIEDLEFRLIRTPEQIAAEKRESAATSLYLTMWPNDTLHECETGNPKWNACLKAIDAGYRKFEIVDE